ncbi:MAG: TlpA disulfide reductase family protein [Steroidobacteraceae bacterium]
MTPRTSSRKRCAVELFAALCIAIAASALPGCGQREPVSAGEPAPADGGPALPMTEPVLLGHYRATLKLPGGETPFGLDIAREDGNYVAYLQNGDERVRVPEITVADGGLSMVMPGFVNSIVAKVDGPELRGKLTLVKRDGKNQVIDFRARHGLKFRFVEEPLTDNADLTGRWAVTFTDSDGNSYPAVGEFRQSHHELSGTFLTPTGDFRYLAGDVLDNEFFLSTFDGAHAYLLRGRIGPDGLMQGKYWSGLASEEIFLGRRDDAAAIEDGESSTRLRSDSEAFGFEFPDLEGNRVNLRDPRFAGKVVVVTLAGSWCPNCHDEAAFLAPYYLRNRDRGFEAIALMFENASNFSEAVVAIQRFRERHDIRYTTLVAGSSDKKLATGQMPQLDAVRAFPTTIFIDRNGKVRRIHTGFDGPATGAHYDELIESFDATVEQLLNEAAATSEVATSAAEP